MSQQIDHYISSQIEEQDLKVYAVKPNLAQSNDSLSVFTNIQTACQGCDNKLSHERYRLLHKKKYSDAHILAIIKIILSMSFLLVLFIVIMLQQR